MRKPAIAYFALSALLTLIASCGGGGGGTNVIPQVIATPGPPNVEPIVVDRGPALLSNRAVNIPYVTIQICNASNQCQTIDHIEVDTGSSGLRILSQALSINLPVATLGGKALAECTQFADGSSFGPLAVVDLTLPTSQKTVSNLAIQVIGAPNYPNVPSDCPGQRGERRRELRRQRHPRRRALHPGLRQRLRGCRLPGRLLLHLRHACDLPGRRGAAGTAGLEPGQLLRRRQQRRDRRAARGVGHRHARPLAGSLVFGINTQTNNTFGSASVATASTDLAYVQATYNGTVFDNGALDSGSNAVYFTDNSITQCTTAVGLYCPNATLNLSATLKGANGTVLTAPFAVANAESELVANPNAAVIPNIGGQLPSAVSGSTAIEFDLGLPFFYGRNVFTGMEGHPAGGYTGPFYAF